MRTIVDLSDEQVRELADLCRPEGLSRTEAVRRAIAEYLRARRPDGELFGLWRDREIDSLEYERSLRREWR